MNGGDYTQDTSSTASYLASSLAAGAALILAHIGQQPLGAALESLDCCQCAPATECESAAVLTARHPPAAAAILWMWSLPSPLPLLLPLAVPSTILDGASTSSLWHHQRLQRAAQQRGLALARLCAQHEPPQLRHRRRRARALLRPPLLRPVLRVQRTVAPEEVRLPQPLLPEAEQRVDLGEAR